MRHTNFVLSISQLSALSRHISLSLTLLAFCGALAWGQTGTQPGALPGPNGVIVHSKFGGQIFGFDIDQNGTEGLLAESKSYPNGIVLAAVETFDQATGNILNVVELTQPAHAQDDFLTMGVVGDSVGLFEHGHVSRFTVTSRTFSVLNPLSSNQLPAPGRHPLDRNTSSCRLASAAARASRSRRIRL